MRFKGINFINLIVLSISIIQLVGADLFNHVLCFCHGDGMLGYYHSNILYSRKLDQTIPYKAGMAYRVDGEPKAIAQRCGRNPPGTETCIDVPNLAHSRASVHYWNWFDGSGYCKNLWGREVCFNRRRIWSNDPPRRTDWP